MSKKVTKKKSTNPHYLFLLIVFKLKVCKKLKAQTMKQKKMKERQKYEKKSKNKNLSAHFQKNPLLVTKNKKKERVESQMMQKK
jgi:hypothetical protein